MSYFQNFRIQDTESSGFRILKPSKMSHLQIFRIQDPESSGQRIRIPQKIISLIAKVCFFVLFHEQTCTRFTRLFGCLVVWLSPCQKYLKNPYNAIFLKSQGSKDIKNDILDCQIHKYTNTNSQIHKYSL